MKELVIFTLYDSWNITYSDISANVKYITVYKNLEKKFPSKLAVLKNELFSFFAALKSFNKLNNKNVLCHGGQIGILLFSKLFPFLTGKNFHLFIYNFYIHDSGDLGVVKLILKFLLNNKKCTLIVQSAFELEYYKKLIPSLDLKYVPYCSDVNGSKHLKLGSYVFTGGYTNRDYNLMLKLATLKPEIEFVFVVSLLNNEFNNIIIPKNLKLYKDISADEFEKLLAQSKIVVVPLKNEVGSSGQMLCIQAMRNKKAIIYSEASSINGYFIDGNSGISYTKGDLYKLSKILDELFADENRILKMGEFAYIESLQFTIEMRNMRLIQIIYDQR
jgi:glycosyltransferase involved in cell wall biosynthesis